MHKPGEVSDWSVVQKLLVVMVVVVGVMVGGGGVVFIAYISLFSICF